MPWICSFQSAIYSEKLYEVYNARDRKDAIKENIKNAKKLTKDLETSGKEMKKMQKETMKKLDEELKKHLDETKELKDNYLNQSKEDRDKAVEDIKRISKAMTNKFDTLKKANKGIFIAASKSIKMKIRNTKERSLMHRITIMDLFTDYCDAKMYVSFESCESEVPRLQDNFPEILEKILKLRIDALDIYSTTGK